MKINKYEKLMCAFSLNAGSLFQAGILYIISLYYLPLPLHVQSTLGTRLVHNRNNELTRMNK